MLTRHKLYMGDSGTDTQNKKVLSATPYIFHQIGLITTTVTSYPGRPNTSAVTYCHGVIA